MRWTVLGPMVTVPHFLKVYYQHTMYRALRWHDLTWRCDSVRIGLDELRKI